MQQQNCIQQKNPGEETTNTKCIFNNCTVWLRNHLKLQGNEVQNENLKKNCIVTCAQETFATCFQTVYNFERKKLTDSS